LVSQFAGNAGGEKKTYDEIALELAPGTCLGLGGFKVVDVVVEHDVDTAGGNVLLDSLAVFVGIGRVKKQGVRVDDGNLLARELVLDLAGIF
jgi:hypothetical protein